MGKNYNINRKPLSEEEILKTKNFEQVVKEAKKFPPDDPIKNKGWFKKVMASLAVAAAAVILIFTSNNEETKTSVQEKQVKKFHTQSVIINTKYDGCEIFYITESADTFTTKYGTQLFIPENLLNLGSDSLAIGVNEFHDWASITMAGIPMTYDSAGTTYAFETGGMIDIRPLEGQHTFQKGKEITVKMVSLTDDPTFNHYAFNEESRQWEYDGKEEIVPVNNETAVIQEFDTNDKDAEKLLDAKNRCTKTIINLQKEMPEAPKKADPKNYSFDLDIDVKEFPEFASFRNVIFEVLPHQGFDASIYEVSWDDMELKKTHKSYEITLIKKNENKSFKVKPALEGSDFEKAYGSYEKEKRELEQKLVEEQQRLQEINDQLEAQKMTYNTQNTQDKILDIQEPEKEEVVKSPFYKSLDFSRYQRSNSTNQKIKYSAQRIFNVSNFGLYNCDKARKYPSKVITQVSFEDENGKTVEMGTYYLAETNKNAAYTFNNSIGDGLFRINPKRDNIVWGNVLGGGIAVSEKKNWDDIKETKKIPVKIYENCNTTVLSDALGLNNEE